VMMNINGYESLDEVMERGLRALNPDAFEAAANETEALLLDTRSPEEFAKVHIPGSINIGIDGNFAPWAGALIPDIKQNILLITAPGREEECITRLSRVGYDKTLGFLEGGMDAWIKSNKETDKVERISATELEAMQAENPVIIDVRNNSEYNAEHLESAKHIPLDYINEHLAEFPKDKPFILHCAGGYRSMIAASILKARGYHDLKDVVGGFKEIAKTNLPKTEFQCASGS